MGCPLRDTIPSIIFAIYARVIQDRMALMHVQFVWLGADPHLGLQLKPGSSKPQGASIQTDFISQPAGAMLPA